MLPTCRRCRGARRFVLDTQEALITSSSARWVFCACQTTRLPRSSLRGDRRSRRPKCHIPGIVPVHSSAQKRAEPELLRSLRRQKHLLLRLQRLRCQESSGTSCHFAGQTSNIKACQGRCGTPVHAEAPAGRTDLEALLACRTWSQTRSSTSHMAAITQTTVLRSSSSQLLTQNAMHIASVPALQPPKSVRLELMRHKLLMPGTCVSPSLLACNPTFAGPETIVPLPEPCQLPSSREQAVPSNLKLHSYAVGPKHRMHWLPHAASSPMICANSRSTASLPGSCTPQSQLNSAWVDNNPKTAQGASKSVHV